MQEIKIKKTFDTEDVFSLISKIEELYSESVAIEIRRREYARLLKKILIQRELIPFDSWHIVKNSNTSTDEELCLMVLDPENQLDIHEAKNPKWRS